MEHGNDDFNSWSFTIGVLTGFSLRMTDVVPLLGGFIFGLCVKNLPEIVQLRQFPTKVREIMIKLTDKIQ